MSVKVGYRETKHFLLTRDFLNSPESFFKRWFSHGSAGGRGDLRCNCGPESPTTVRFHSFSGSLMGKSLARFV